MICRWIAFNPSKLSRVLSPFSSLVSTKLSSSSVAKLDDEPLSAANFASDQGDYFRREILFGMKKIGFREYLHGRQFRSLASELKQVHVEEIMCELMGESSDLSVWFFKELKDVYGFRHSRLSSLLVSHILAGQRRFKELQVVVEQLLQEEGKSSLLSDSLSLKA
uniref:Uncharacterized protein n=1 Tax=Brassica campestris TaxID=3711 RepID=M4FHZ7_BRACM